jgi:putative NADPH-quinone reductase
MEMDYMTRIAIVQGHPDPAPERFCRALAHAYAEAARAAGHEVRVIDIAALDFPVLRTRSAWESEPPPAAIAAAIEDLKWSGHIAIFFPLWLGAPPALLKAFLEQVMRPGGAFRYRPKGLPEKLLGGRSARVVVTMGMPGFFYEVFYRAHAIRALERNVLGFVGIHPVRRTVVGAVEAKSGKGRAEALATMHRLGRSAR